MFPYDKEHVDDVRRARRDVNQVGLVVVWVCMAHNEDYCVKGIPTGEEVVLRLCVGSHIDSLLSEEIQ